MTSSVTLEEDKTGSTGSVRGSKVRGRTPSVQISAPAQSDGLQQADEGAVRLSAHLRQLHVNLDALPPTPCLQKNKNIVKDCVQTTEQRESLK